MNVDKAKTGKSGCSVFAAGDAVHRSVGGTGGMAGALSFAAVSVS